MERLEAEQTGLRYVHSEELKHQEEQSVSAQGPALQAFLYKLLWSKEFGHFVNLCRVSVMTMATIDAVKVTLEDFPDLDLRKKEYGYTKRGATGLIGTLPRLC